LVETNIQAWLNYILSNATYMVLLLSDNVTSSYCVCCAIPSGYYSRCCRSYPYLAPVLTADFYIHQKHQLKTKTMIVIIFFKTD